MTHITENELKKKYLDLLSQRFDSAEKLATEIINLESILELPKGTEHFVSDLHGEYESFQHVLRNGSGNVRAKINDIFGETLSEKEINDLAALVYYPEDKLKLVKNQFNAKGQLNVWYITTIERLVELIKYCSSKYTRSKLRKALPEQFVYIIEELLYKNNEYQNKKTYYETLVNQVIELEQSDDLIIGLSYTVQRLVVDHLHVVGDIYDRGPKPDKIMDTLINYHSVDIQWGNHDVLWIGAYAGSKVCLANLLRICARYDNLDIIEDAYGINLRPLLTLAEKYYSGDNPAFKPKKRPDKEASLTQREEHQITKIHQAIAMIQFKLEMPIIKRRPSFEMEERLVLEKIDFDNNEITVYGKTYPLKDTCFQTIDRQHPEVLLEEEQEVIDKLLLSFQQSEKLRRHMSFLMREGKLYLPYNGNLLIHGCIPVDENGEMESFEIDGEMHSGRELLDVFEYHVRKAFDDKEVTDDLSTDLVWYLWTGKYSSLFGKRAMTTFERYFIEDKASHKEVKNPYYYLREDVDMIRKMLSDFGLNPDEGRIINGHTPVKEIDGEDPIKADGKMLVIDGGFSKAYQSTTGIAGYTLLYNSFGMQLVAHQEFNTKEKVLSDGTDELSVKRVVDEELTRKKIKDTNVGQELQSQIDILKILMHDRYLK
ncbi:fructose-1,6-bisphosphatase [Staphylococcus warneri]|uniref:Fructose-1,6-bisphosphatase class 3 n=5 Tax=Staphylococcus TaxID=1279 RepID=A0A6H3FG14_STAWA|nr:fructose-bisphosphatase class III [Staphylococcus warneri]SKR67420.1 Fructose-1,6-bisphosphatase class 3 [Mycobacteroides abscessus subsp. abscessus]AGC89719.1 fructose-1,6-bisphosphatase [Staphylococcus warneri SG1]EGG96306.1 firmicute fructose-1,6-bisphosphatase [Staphylococcus warneri VCU121]KEK50085.1 fructose-1,6-bisphosphatase class 3 [Staphylococcus warneri Lyso 1 2011]KEK56675.1 fructose-1,6-bisphosphatase class 3 [Staphylococcus warneri Lyso 2 2011]